jgi:hypothetical protein
MIRVHEKQLGEMERTLGLERFEDEMVVHLHSFAPRHAEVIGDDWVRRTIRLGIERARAYEVTNPGLLRFYVELMFMFGSMFDTDPLLPWAGAVLRDPTLPGEVARMERLHEAMLWYLDTVCGPERSFAIQALRNLQQVRLDDALATDLRVERKALEMFAHAYPERCAYLGEPPLQELFRRGAEVAARYDVATNRGIAVVTGLMFAVGHGFAEDPQCPWVQATLRDRSIGDPERRAARLQKRTEIYMGRALDYFDRRRSDV